MSLLRRTCVACGRDGVTLCRECRARLEPPPATRIRDIGPVDALFAYDGVGVAVVQALKFRNARAVVASVADDLAAMVAARSPDLSATTWLPTSAARRRQRGFDQAELLARSVARRLGVPAVPLLRRRPGRPQTGLSWEERAGNVQFGLHRRGSRISGSVAIFDDVCTTGATMRAAWRTLGEPADDDVTFFALARTP